LQLSISSLKTASCLGGDPIINQEKGSDEPPRQPKRGKSSSNLAIPLKVCGIWRNRARLLVVMPTITTITAHRRFRDTMILLCSPPKVARRNISIVLSPEKL
jgi:hypothetical protein